MLFYFLVCYFTFQGDLIFLLNLLIKNKKNKLCNAKNEIIV